MLSDLRAPRELVLLMRFVAILGAAKIATVVYYDLLFATEPTAAEIAVSEGEIRRIAEEGEARVFADFRRRAPGVLEAAQECAEPGDASCRWAEIWIERYRLKADDVLRSPAEYGAQTATAARQYRSAIAALDRGSAPPSAR